MLSHHSGSPTAISNLPIAFGARGERTYIWCITKRIIMKNLIAFLCLTLFPFTSIMVYGQSFDFADPDEILIGNKSIPKVLLVGTFHFGYPNQDAYKVKEEDKVDILSQEKQQEVEKLVDYIARFRPTKIVVEAGHNSGYVLRRYESWQAGESELRAQEIDQVAFRLMEQFQLDTLYGCDAPGLTYSMEQSTDPTVMNAYLEEVFEDYDWQSEDPMDKIYDDWYAQQAKYSLDAPLLDYLKYLNSNKVIRRMHGAYLIGDFKLDEFRGADALALYWYSRNLRIFRRIQEIDAGPEDRILVLFGAGHIAILKEQFEASPEYEVVLFSDLK